MTNNIVFTQDVPGEREWLKSQFPGCELLETEFSNKWPAEPFVQEFDAVYEIPPDSSLDVINIDGVKYKSLYQLDKDFISPKWCDANQLLINGLDFTSQPKSKKAQILHFQRSGTIFLESILFRKCNYDKDRGWSPTADHARMGGDDRLLYSVIQQSQPDIFFCYRKNWWDWFVSLQIAYQFNYYHYFDNIDWGKLPSFDITEKHIKEELKEVHASWNAMCHFRTLYPHLNFYIFEFSDLIQNQNLTEHKKMHYDKTKLIKNYDDAKAFFESRYLSTFDRWATNAISHLQTMNCKVLKNFDSLIA